MKVRYSNIIAVVIVSLAFALNSFSQISFGGIPKSSPLTRSGAEMAVPCISVSIDSTASETRVDDNVPCAMSFATAIPVDIDLKKEAVSSGISDGFVQYKLMIASKGAVSLNLIFSEFVLPDNARLFLSTPNMGEMLGAYTNKSLVAPFQFATTPIESDTLLLTYEEPANANGKLKISRVNRGFYSLRKLPQFSRSEECEVDAECEPDSFETMRRSTCLYIVNGTSYCTGTLVANTKGTATPYILTSAHCLFDVNNMVDTALAKTCVFFFDYKSPLCGSQIEGTREKSIVGAKAMSCYNRRDALLLRLSQVPPVDYMPYYAPWDATGDLEGPSICFHHPSGDVMKASYEADDLRDTSFSSLIFDRDCHLKVNDWERGISEGGSSGAALYNHGMVVGALSGGAKEISCDNTGFDCFWSLERTWDAFFPYLSPLDTSVRICEGYQPYNYPCDIVANYAKSSTLSEGYVEDYGYIAGTNADNVTKLAEKFVLPGKTNIFGVSFFPVIATYSADAPIVMSLLDGEMNTLWTDEIKVTNVEYVKKSQTMSDRTVNSMSYKENYIRFESPISVDSVVYVTFDFSNTTQKFALFNIVDDAEVSTAYYSKDGEWRNFDSKQVSSLMVNLTAQNTEANGIKTKIRDEIVVFPNPSSGDFSVCWGKPCDVMVSIVNILGQVVFIESFENKSSVEINAQLPAGVYTLEVADEFGVRTKRIAVR